MLLAYAGFAVLSVALAIIDARTHRLPNRLVLPAYPVLLLLLVLASAALGTNPALLTAVLASVAVFVFFLLLRWAQPRGMGGGDVKLAAVVGLVLGYLGWDAVLWGVLAGFLSGGLYSVFLLSARRATRRTAIPFGPWMLLGAWLAIGAHAVL
ncbi:A24 family peptidase [Microbacterium sp. NPDC089189]|uniref:prepilin peptidase n=1 Tax=Microbacterium sp. NPDC089189 TaxID=3154972 RepID=UPI00342A403B